MMTLKRIPFVVLLLAIFTFVACSSDSDGDDGGTGTTTDNFDRQAMLTNWADNIIVPGYVTFMVDVDAMATATTQFTATPNQDNLDNLRTVWEDTYISFQNVSMFEIGPAETARFRNRLNVYPTNTTNIDDAIASGSYDFALPSNITIQGFPAIDYLINGTASTDAEIIALFSTDANAENYRNYLNDLSTTIATLTTQVLNEWQAGFRDSFVANTSSSATGSVDKFANDYIFYYEKALRAGKIGIPAGNFSNETLPQNVEAFYKKDISKALTLESLNAVQEFFNGNGGESFASYLDFLNTIKNGEDLSTLINSQFDVARTQINSLDDNFVTQINTNNTAMLQAFDELQRNVILIKVDMLQALDINVDFVDTDGD